MNAETTNMALYRKLEEEFCLYKAWLLKEAPETILENAYEYSLRQDILTAMSYNDLTAQQAQRLLECPDLLSKLVDRWENSGYSYMDQLFGVIEDASEEADPQ